MMFPQIFSILCYFNSIEIAHTYLILAPVYQRTSSVAALFCHWLGIELLSISSQAVANNHQTHFPAINK